MVWSVNFYSSELENEILALEPVFVARFIRYAERLEHYGPDLGMPHTRSLGKGLFELRLKAALGIARVFYCTVANQRIVMLHQDAKKSQKAPKREPDTARRRMKEVENG